MSNFYKYEGAGNDFLMINNLKGNTNLKPEYIKYLCDRHFGIGADGLISLESSKIANCFMNYYNSDGSLAEMCGNGVRCTAKFYLEQTNSYKNEITIDTRAGIKKILCNVDDTYSVNMGKPIFNHLDFPNISTTLENFNFEFVSMGNPHAITIVKELTEIDIKTIGPKIENNSLFPNKINVEFVEKVDNNYFKVKVWERGCGETLACGTGACAVYAILKNSEPPLFPRNKDAQGLALRKDEIILEFPGGKLFLSQNHEGEIILRGPATFVFKGKIK